MLILGIILLAGFLFGEIAQKIGLPRITGYLLAGLALNPDLSGVIPKDFPEHTSLMTDISLSFITFSVGGTLLASKIRRLGKSILWITFMEAEFALILVCVGCLAFTFLTHAVSGASGSGELVAFCILLGILASPTDPSATLAVSHEYKAKGEVSSTIMGVAAFDDVFGMLNFSLGLAVARLLTLHQGFDMHSALLEPAISIIGALILGSIFGGLFNFLTSLFKKESEGGLIIIVFAMLTLCYGVAHWLKIEELLTTMVMGCFVVNFNAHQKRIFKILERYTEELIFVLFFTISGMKLNFASLSGVYWMVFVFVLFRGVGKYLGTTIGGFLGKSTKQVRHYAPWGLIPQGGIVIGLALVMHSDSAFQSFSDPLLGIVIGATVIHEILGPILVRISLQHAGEIYVSKN